MHLNDRFVVYPTPAVITNYCFQRSYVKNQASSVNRKLVQELAHRPSVIEALREARCIPERFQRNQERESDIKSRLDFRNKHRNLSVHDRLGYVNDKLRLHRRYLRNKYRNLSVHDRLGYVNERSVLHRRYFRNKHRNLSVHDRLGYVKEKTVLHRRHFRNMHHKLSVHDRLGYVKEKTVFYRRYFRSGVSPLIRDQLGLQEPDFEKRRQLNQKENFRKKENFGEKWQSRGDDIYVEVNINESEPKIDMNDAHFKVKFSPNQPRAHPTGIFNFHHGIRYYGPEIFIWVKHCNSIDHLESFKSN